MPQYPMPPWPWGDLTQQRTTRLRANNPRYADLPLVCGHADGTIEVLRGDPTWAEKLAGTDEARSQLFELGKPGDPHYVAMNRMGRVRLISTVRPVVRGLLEFHRWTAEYSPPDAVGSATTFDELREALRAELGRIDELEADGWQLYAEPLPEPEVVDYGDGETIALSPRSTGARFLIDTRRPDETLTERDLP